MNVLPQRPLASRDGFSRSALASHALTLLAIGIAYVIMAKAGLALASINPSATPIWPPTGFAIAAVLIWGYRVWPAILIGAFLANLTTTGTVYTSAAIAIGNTLEAVVGGDLVLSWSAGQDTFETPMRVAKFALIAWIASSVSATIGVGTLSVAGLAPWDNFASIWLTWWLGDMSGALVVTPVMVSWVRDIRTGRWGEGSLESILLFALTAAVGLIALSPVFEPTANRDALGFLSILPLLWAALRRGQRDTATAALGLACFAIWGALAGMGPFARSGLNDSLNMLVMFLVSITVPSLALSAEVAGRRRNEDELRRSQDTLEQRARQRTTALAETNEALHSEIEQRRRIEGELRQQRIQLLEAQRLANLGSWSWDVAQNRLTGSDQLLAIFGLLPHEFPGTFEGFLERVHEGDRVRVESRIRAAIRTGGSFWLEARIRRDDGTIRHLQGAGETIKDDQGQPARLLAVFQDVTARREAEDTLRENEEQHRLMVESVQDCAIFMLDPGGRVMSWNAGAERINAYATTEILGRHFSVFYGGGKADDPMFADKLAQAKALGRVQEEEGWRQRGDGTRFWGSVAMSPVYDRTGELRGFVKVVRDLTRQHEADQRLRDYADRLREMSRQLLDIQETQSRYLARELHDEIGQVLIALKLNMQALKGKTTAPDNSRQLAESVTIIDEALQQIRDLAHELRPSILDDLGLEAALRWFANRQAERAGFTVALSCDPLPQQISGEVQTACFRVAQQALTNVARHAKARQVSTSVEVEQEALILTIADDGTGFEVASAAKESAAGRSFGLLSMQERVALLGGELRIDSDTKGTRVVARFPMQRRSAAAEAAAG